MKKTFLFLICTALLFSACDTAQNPAEDADVHSSESVETIQAVSEDIAQNPAEDTDVLTSEPAETIQAISERTDLTEVPDDETLPADFVFPITDGSTSTTNLDNAVRSAVLGGEQSVVHTKTYDSFYRLLDGACDLIFTTPLSEVQLNVMENVNFRHEAEPIAGEGFVFVVNRDNPVDTLTVEQIKGIYSGAITNWQEVGGADAEIVAYQRNADSGSQNYMRAFMGDTPLMEPITDIIPATMSGILDVIAHYDNGIHAIGYSVYAYSDGMYEDLSDIKYIKVNGVEPSLTTLADGSYPLLGYNYAVYSADEPEDSPVRALVRWIQSDEGQQVIANAGYIPYRRVEGLTLPEPTVGTLYTAAATSGIAKPAVTADKYYQCNIVPDTFLTPGLDAAIAAFIAGAQEELSVYDPVDILAALGLPDNGYRPRIDIQKRLTNGYLSVEVGWSYMYGYEDSPYYYYDVRTAVFDIYTGARLEMSDLFFDGVDFVPMLNSHLAQLAEKPYSGWGSRYDMLHDFRGLYEGEFTFTADSIIFRPNTCFADGVVLSLDGLRDSMVTSIPRDMAGCVPQDVPVYPKLYTAEDTEICSAEEKNGITVMYLDPDKTTVASAVCAKVNAFVDNTFETYFTADAIGAAIEQRGYDADGLEVGPYPDFGVRLVGDRYIKFSGANQVSGMFGEDYVEFPVIEGHENPYWFAYYFNAQTGDALRIGDLFSDGWETEAKDYINDDSFHTRDESTQKPYSTVYDRNACRVTSILEYEAPPYNRGDLTDLEIPVCVTLITESGDRVAVLVPRSYIK